MARPKIPLLSADRIADAAIELVDSGAPFGVNALARRLGVTPSSLYHHAAGLDAILELMRGRINDRHLIEVPRDRPWDEVLAFVAREQRQMYAAHPHALPLLIGRTASAPPVVAVYEALATTLSEAGFPDSEVLRVIALFDAFTIGVGLDLIAPEAVWETDDPTSTLGRLLPSAASGRQRSGEAFELGLDLLLAGLRDRLRELGTDPTAPHAND